MTGTSASFLPPRWYLPPGVPPPAHLLSEFVRLQAQPTVGAGGLPPGGLFVGGVPLDGEDLSRWHVHPKGYAFWHDKTDPLAFVRVDPPQIAAWKPVPAPNGGHWRVPVLFQPVRKDKKIVDITPTCVRLWRNGRWEFPVEIAPVLQELLRFAISVAENPATPIDDITAINLAVTVLLLGHHFDPDEVSASGLLSDASIAGILLTAVGGPFDDAVSS